LSVDWAHLLGSCKITQSPYYQMRISGDGMTLGQFIQTWSDYYQDFSPATVPTFEKYLDQAPTIERQLVYDTLSQVPHLGVHYSTERFHEMFNEMQSTTSRVDIKLACEEIMTIRDIARKSTKIRVSTICTAGSNIDYFH